MPLALGKEDTLDLFLETDKELPEKERPTFTFKFLTGREQRKLAKEMDFKNTNNTETIDAVFELLKKYLLGWNNIPVEFKEEKFMDVLRWQEAQELLSSNLHFNPQLEMLKNLGLQLLTPTDESVKPENVETAKNQ